jgi:hypothetical protein
MTKSVSNQLSLATASILGQPPRGSTLNEEHRMVPVLVKAALKMADKINRRIG